MSNDNNLSKQEFNLISFLDNVISWEGGMNYEMAAKFVIRNKELYNKDAVEACMQYLMDITLEG